MGVDEPDLFKQVQLYPEAMGEPVGDCWRTSIACLLGVPANTVPHFADLYKDEDSLSWWNASVLWVEDNLPGWTLICVAPDFPVYYEDVADAPDRVIITGGSPRGDWNHCAIGDAKTGEIVWDPSPHQTGLVDVKEVFALTTIAQYAVVD